MPRSGFPYADGVDRITYRSIPTPWGQLRGLPVGSAITVLERLYLHCFYLEILAIPFECRHINLVRAAMRAVIFKASPHDENP